MPEDVRLVQSELGGAATAYENATRPFEQAAHGLPTAPPYMGAVSPAYAEALAELLNACANLNEVAQLTANDLRACRDTYGANEDQNASMFDNVKR